MTGSMSQASCTGRYRVRVRRFSAESADLQFREVVIPQHARASRVPITSLPTMSLHDCAAFRRCRVFRLQHRRRGAVMSRRRQPRLSSILRRHACMNRCHVHTASSRAIRIRTCYREEATSARHRRERHKPRHPQKQINLCTCYLRNHTAARQRPRQSHVNVWVSGLSWLRRHSYLADLLFGDCSQVCWGVSPACVTCTIA